MKKIVCLGMVFVILLVLSGCGGDKKQGAEDPDQVAIYSNFTKVIAEMEKVEDFAFQLGIKTQDTKDENADAIKIDIDGEQVMQNDQASQSMMEFRAGNQETGKCYLKNDEVYMDLPDGKSKLSREENAAILSPVSGLSMPKEAIDSITADKKGEDTIYHFSLKDEAARLYYINNIDGIHRLLKINKDISPSQVNIAVTVGKDNRVKDLRIESKLKSGGSETADLLYSLSLQYSSLNTGLTIKYPDLEEYSDIPQLTDLN